MGDGDATAAHACPLVIIDLWGVRPRHVPHAAARMALDRRHLRRTTGLVFARSLGTGRGRTFGPRDADVLRWAVLTVWASAREAASFERSAMIDAWSAIAYERWRAELHPLSSRGRWARQRPFGDPVTQLAGLARPAGLIAAITRARLSLRRAPAFWRSVPPVAEDLTRCEGLRFAVGIGEAPLGLQGTFSVWDDADALRRFAYGSPAHTDVVRRTFEHGWYKEELFARFAVLRAHGTVNGCDPLARSGRTPSGGHHEHPRG
ncbi:spheroidene monooxygenase [Frankia sp. CiP3]|uniref:spheroidene monooxygenase n=1 Tax=Frankia sp. CiP3 TaxID=2880971 RepID=UPI001EF69792|nr:spheroidene monooxygenase [Frankia sp. CiP3]